MLGSLASAPGFMPVTSSLLCGGKGLRTKSGESVFVPMGTLLEEASAPGVAPLAVEEDRDVPDSFAALVPRVTESLPGAAGAGDDDAGGSEGFTTVLSVGASDPATEAALVGAAAASTGSGGLIGAASFGEAMVTFSTFTPVEERLVVFRVGACTGFTVVRCCVTSTSGLGGARAFFISVFALACSSTA